MENHFYHIRLAHLSVTIFVTDVRIQRNGRYANVVDLVFGLNLAVYWLRLGCTDAQFHLTILTVQWSAMY